MFCYLKTTGFPDNIFSLTKGQFPDISRMTTKFPDIAGFSGLPESGHPESSKHSQ